VSSAVVLGAGLVGSVIARDLAEDVEVLLVDRDEGALGRARERCPSLAVQQADVREASTWLDRAQRADVVVGALSSELGHAALETLVEAGCAVVDIAFFDRDARELDAQARATGARVVFDMGLAPGMSNILAVDAAGRLDEVEDVEIVVGGVPKQPRPPFFYKAAFSPRDVLEEYTRPARVVEAGRVVERPALSSERFVEFEGRGVFSCFLTDGLRSLAGSGLAPNMRERTLRHCEHTPLMRFLRDAGFFSADPALLPGGGSIRPLDATAAIVLPAWRYEEGEADLTLFRVTAQGRRDGSPAQVVWELDDEYDPVSRTTSMARTTAFPAAVVARLLASGAISEAGVHPPEALADTPRIVEQLLREQRERGVEYVLRQG